MYALYFCGTEVDPPGWMTNYEMSVFVFVYKELAAAVREYLYTGEEEIEIREYTEGGPVIQTGLEKLIEKLRSDSGGRG